MQCELAKKTRSLMDVMIKLSFAPQPGEFITVSGTSYSQSGAVEQQRYEVASRQGYQHTTASYSPDTAESKRAA